MWDKNTIFLSEEIKNRNARCERFEIETDSCGFLISLHYGRDYATIKIPGALNKIDSEFYLVGDASTLKYFEDITKDNRRISALNIIDYIWSLNDYRIQFKLLKTIFEAGEYTGISRKSNELRKFLNDF